MKHLTAHNFETTLQENEWVLVDFWAPWCGPCRMVAPTLETLDAELGDKVTFGKVNVDEEEELSQQYRVMSIPTLILFKNGKVAGKIIGAVPKQKIIDMIQNNLQ